MGETEDNMKWMSMDIIAPLFYYVTCSSLNFGFNLTAVARLNLSLRICSCLLNERLSHHSFLSHDS